MSIESEIERLQIAKSNLKTAIMGKGVHVDDTDKLDTYYMLVSQIEEGSGGGGIDVSATTVTAGDVLAGKKFYTADGVLTEGTIEEALISGKDDKFGVSITSGYLPEPFEYYATNGTYEIAQNTVVLKSGYFKAQTIDVGTRYEQDAVTPGTSDQTIPKDSYIVYGVTVKGEPAYLSENIKKGVSLWGLEGSYEGEGGIDTSDATVTSEDLTVGTVAYGKNGKVYGSRIYAEDPIVYFHNGQLKADQPVYLDPGNPVTMYTFDGTASPDSIVEGETVYVAGGKVTGSMGHLTVGGMVIQENAILSIPSKSYVEFENYQLRDIAGIGDLASENIAKGKTIAGIAGTFEGSGGSFDIVKVTEYSPYVPAYPEQIGFVFDIDATEPTPDGAIPYDASAYEGLYTVTEETKTCTSFGRAYRNANGKYLYAFTYETWSQATDESSSAYWCIGDSLGNGPDSGAFINANEVNNGVFPSEATGWTNAMGFPTINSCTVTSQVTAPATEAIPMVLKGSVTTGYTTGTREWVDGTTSNTYRGFEVEPYKDWYYASFDNKLIGGAVGSSVQYTFYTSMSHETTTAETGETLTFINRSDYPGKFNTVDGVACYDLSADSANRIETTSPSGVFATGKPFAVSIFMRLDNQVYADKWALAVGTNSANKGFCIGYTSDMCIQTTGTGTADSRYISKKAYKGKWVHVFVVNHVEYEEIYINGDLDGTLNWKREVQDTGTMYLGSWFGSGGLGGYIAQIKIYNAVVSPVQVKNEADRCLAMVGSGDSSGNVNWGDDDLNDTGS